MDIVEILTNYVAHYTYVGVVLFTFSGVIGMPIPHELMLLIAGYLASIGVVSLFWVCVVAVVSTLLADNLSFYIGRKEGTVFLRSSLSKRIFLTPERVKRMENYFNIHGGKTVFFMRFLMAFRAISFMIAGSSNMSWWKFNKYNFLGIVLWEPTVILIGYYVSSGFVKVWDYFNSLKYIILGVIVLFILGYIIYSRYFRKSNSQN